MLLVLCNSNSCNLQGTMLLSQNTSNQNTFIAIQIILYQIKNQNSLREVHQLSS